MISVPSTTPDKPRYRSACEPCRQSKVKCSGGTTCMRCSKHGFPCHYSIASRAGKPKGSKNKATLRKLETLQGKGPDDQKSGSNGAGEAARKTKTVISTAFLSSKDEFLHQQPSRPPGCETMATELDSANTGPSSIHMADMDMDQAALAYLSPISTSPRNNHFMPDLSVATESGDPLSTTSSGISDAAAYLSPVSTDQIFDFSPPSFHHNSFTEPPTPVEFCCDCLERQILSQNKLYFLEQDVASASASASVVGGGRLDMMVDTMLSSLAVCQRFAECPVCPKECPNLLMSLSTLERVLAVLGQMMPFFRGGCCSSAGTSAQPAAAPPASSSPTEHGNMYPMCPKPAIIHNPSPAVHRVLRKSRDLLATLRTIMGLPPNPLLVEGNHQNPPDYIHQGHHGAWQARAGPMEHSMNTLALGLTHDFSPPEYEYDYSVEDEWLAGIAVVFAGGRYQTQQTRYDLSNPGGNLRQAIARCEVILESLHREWAGQPA